MAYYRKRYARRYKKRSPPSSKLSAIKKKAYRATTRKNRNAVSAVARRLSALERRTKLLRIRQCYYTSNNSTDLNIPTNLSYGVFAQFQVNDPQTFTQMFGYDNLITEGAIAYHKNSRVNFHMELKEAVTTPLFVNIAIVRLKSAYRQLLTQAEAGAGLQSSLSWVNGREMFRDANYTNGALNMMFNPRFFTVVAKKRLQLGNSTGTGGYSPGTNTKDFSLKFRVNTKYKKVGGITSTDDSSWIVMDGKDLRLSNQFYCLVWHEGFDEVVHDNGLTCRFSYEARHTIRQQIQNNYV